jgi:tetratricopeptide (TPR) repeat protein
VRPCPSLFVSVWVAFTIGSSWAQTGQTEPARLFKEGQASYAAGNYRAAAESFAAANALAPRGACLYNEGMSWLGAGERARAADAFDQALELEHFEPALEAEARAELSKLQKELATVSLTEPAGGVASVAHVHDARLPLRFHLEPGTYDVDFKGPGGELGTHPLRAVAGEQLSVRLEVPPPVVAPPRIVEVVRPAPPERRSTRPWGWAAVGLAGVCAGVSTYMGVQALSAKNSYVATNDTDVGAYDRAATLRTATNVGWAVAAVSAAGGAWLLLRSEPHSTVSEVRVSASPSAVALRLSF